MSSASAGGGILTPLIQTATMRKSISDQYGRIPAADASLLSNVSGITPLPSVHVPVDLKVTKLGAVTVGGCPRLTATLRETRPLGVLPLSRIQLVETPHYGAFSSRSA